MRSTTVITKKNARDLTFGMEQDIDYIAMSFVGRAQESMQLRKMIKVHGKSTPIIAKIKRRATLARLSQIVRVSDAIMIVARDLGNEIPLKKNPMDRKKDR